MSAVVIFGKTFGDRTAYKPETRPYDQKRAWLDLLHIESYPTDVNNVLARVGYAKAELEVEVKSLQDGEWQNYRCIRIKNFQDLVEAFARSTVADWRIQPHYYATIALEIEYRVACAQRYRVEEVPQWKKA